MWLDKFKARKKIYLGIDIGASAVKLVALSSNSKQHYQLVHYASIPLASHPVGADDSENLAVTTQAIRRALLAIPARSYQVVIALPSSQVLTQIIELPAELSEEDIAAHLQVNAERYFITAAPEISFDFAVLGQVENKPDWMQVLLVMTQQRYVADRLAMLQAAGRTAAAVTAEGCALAAAVMLLPASLAVQPNRCALGLLYVAAAELKLHVIHGGQVIFSHTERLTEIASGTASPPLLADITSQQQTAQSLLDAVLSHTQRALHCFFAASQSQQWKISQLLLGGELSASQKIAAFLQQQLAIPTFVVNPFTAMPIAHGVDKQRLLQDAPELLLSCGLALQGLSGEGINFLPWRRQLQQQRKRKFVMQLLAATNFALLGIVSAHVYGWHLCQLQEQRNALWQQEITAIKQPPQAAAVLSGQRQNLLAQLLQWQRWQLQRTAVARLFNILTQATPAELALISMQRTSDKLGDKLVVVGESSNPLVAEQWVQQLEKAGLFSAGTVPVVTPINQLQAPRLSAEALAMGDSLNIPSQVKFPRFKLQCRVD